MSASLNPDKRSPSTCAELALVGGLAPLVGGLLIPMKFLLILFPNDPPGITSYELVREGLFCALLAIFDGACGENKASSGEKKIKNKPRLLLRNLLAVLGKRPRRFEKLVRLCVGALNPVALEVLPVKTHPHVKKVILGQKTSALDLLRATSGAMSAERSTAAESGSPIEPAEAESPSASSNGLLAAIAVMHKSNLGSKSSSGSYKDLLGGGMVLGSAGNPPLGFFSRRSSLQHPGHGRRRRRRKWKKKKQMDEPLHRGTFFTVPSHHRHHPPPPPPKHVQCERFAVC